VVTPSLRRRIFTFFDRSLSGAISLGDYAAAVVRLGSTGSPRTRMLFIFHIMAGKDGALREADCRFFFELFITSHETMSEGEEGCEGVMQASMEWMGDFFAVSEHECLSEESLCVFLEVSHAQAWSYIPEHVAVSKLMIWRAVGEFCRWFDHSELTTPRGDGPTKPAAMTREAYFGGSLWRETGMSDHCDTFRNINRSGGETLVREDAYTLAVVCGYTGAYKASFADSFVGLNQDQFAKQMEEQEYFAPFPSSNRYKVPRPTDPAMAQEWIIFIQAAARLMSHDAAARSRAEGGEKARGCRGCGSPLKAIQQALSPTRQDPREGEGKKCAVM